MTISEKIIWLAGFLEGEGSFGCVDKGRSRTIQITFHSTDEDVAKTAAAIMGAKAGGPYQRSTNSLGRKPYWAVRLSGDKAALLMRDIRPWMGIRRRSQIDEAIRQWDGRPTKKMPRTGNRFYAPVKAKRLAALGLIDAADAILAGHSLGAARAGVAAGYALLERGKT